MGELDDLRAKLALREEMLATVIAEGGLEQFARRNLTLRLRVEKLVDKLAEAPPAAAQNTQELDDERG